MEFPPDPQEFQWYDTQAKHGDWRMGERIEIVTHSSGWVVKSLLFGSIAGVYLIMFGRIWQSWGGGIMGTCIALAAAMACWWYVSGGRVAIDWATGTVTYHRACLRKRRQIAELQSVELGDGPSKLIETSMLSLKFSRTSIPLIETFGKSKPHKRDAELATLGRRLAEMLNVPFETIRDKQQVIASAMSDQELAEKYTEEGERLALHGDHVEMRGDLAEAKTYRDEAAWHFKYALQLDPDHGPAYVGLGRISNDDNVRLQAADLAVEIDATNVDVLLERAHARDLAGEKDTAMQDYDRAIELERSARTLRTRGIALYFRNRLEDALRDFEDAIEAEPNDAELHYWRSECWRRIFDSSNMRSHLHLAIEAMENAVRHEDPDRSYEANLRKLESIRDRDQSRSIEELNRLCEADPDDIALLQTRGELLLHEGQRMDEAIADFSKIISLMERNVSPGKILDSSLRGAIGWAYRMRSEAHRQNGDLESADRDQEQATELENA